nr:D-alanyl-D-alanine carboxypeptidase [Allomuricauda sp.]
MLTIIKFVVFFLLIGCSSIRLPQYADKVSSEPLSLSFHALVVRQPDVNKELFNHNGERYFTPASNTKIVTLYSGNQLLPKKAPALKYISQNDTIYFEGTGDPSFLHPYFQDSTALNFIKSHKVAMWFPNNTTEDRFGPGWAWEDFDTYFSPEKTALPIYGNVVSVWLDPLLQVSPAHFKDKFLPVKKRFLRAELQNEFYLETKINDTLEIPFITGPLLVQQLLQEALDKEVLLLREFPEGPKKTLSGIPMDSIYKRLMHKSDNFLAEQILMLASSTLSDTLSTRTAIDHMLENQLSDLQAQPRWVDGSGLSRYNLFTPRSLTHILQKLYDEMSHDRLFQIFPMWDATGTVETWDHQDVPPFIFAKSGSFGNHYNLSGYLKTSSGKMLIFSMMNNHFRVPSAQIRQEMFTTLKEIHRKY